jgi:hypothetical protein
MCSITRRSVVPTLALMMAALCAQSLAQEYLSYPEFRYTGGLPGNGFAVDGKGNAGFHGAMSQCIPLGYTPGHGSYALALNMGTVKGAGGLALGLGPSSNYNVFVGYGFTVAKHAVCFSLDGVDRHFDPAYNLQVQVVNETEKMPAIAVGGQDHELLRRHPGTTAWGRRCASFYVAATKQVGSKRHPVDMTAGLGTDRFRGAFAGASYDVTKRVKMLAEYDAFAWNAGVAADLLGGKHNALVLYAGLASLNRPVLGLSYAH